MTFPGTISGAVLCVWGLYTLFAAFVNDDQKSRSTQYLLGTGIFLAGLYSLSRGARGYRISPRKP